MLLPNEVKLMESLKQEAFNYAYYCKREQPTVDEAQHAYESGAYPDEIVRDKAWGVNVTYAGREVAVAIVIYWRMAKK